MCIATSLARCARRATGTRKLSCGAGWAVRTRRSGQRKAAAPVAVWPLTEVAALSREGEKVAPSGSGAPFWARATRSERALREALSPSIG